ncbi:hypothetical protein G4B88_014774 [Cannabis sativa]|uniref:RNA-dependent RNA polymerase n=1 Tax=Cannabis sativa TaxID=3483 RepID=A0A7J6IB82_CANSA|nr:hypothetical protein G4B88_014774 [Cannabis sativa]
MELERKEKRCVVTQISIGGFDRNVKAKDLVNFLEDEVGLVFRCRLKTSLTPAESHPNFEVIDTANLERADNNSVVPHAFVHFASPDSATDALMIAESGNLMLDGNPLKVSLGPENPYSMNQRRRTISPRKIPDVLLEIGTLVKRDEFFSAWSGAPRGVDFVVDPFNWTCKFCFTKDTVFSFKGMAKLSTMKCDFKVEFLVRDINEIKTYTDTSYLVVLLHLASSPRVWYRTADDDIDIPAPFDMLDDDDPWIRTTDFTPSGAVGRCNYYRISVPPRHGAKLKKAMEYLRQQRVHESNLRSPLRIRKEPDYGVSMSDPFFCIHYKKDISFEIMFLLNVVMHKGVFNQYQFSDDLFDLLRSQPLEVNVSALKYIMCSIKRPVYNACEKLKHVQEWLLREPKLLKIPRQLDDIAEVRRLVITPTRAYCLPPEAELSNRVLRHFKEVADRFLRVTFMDEGMQTINLNVLTYFVAPIVKELTNNSFPQKTKVFNRVKNILTEGFYLCGRKYSFLAFSSNQLRDRSAWFFAENGIVSVLHIKRWMGKFTNRNVAKCAARMGQCFSSTYATVEVPLTEVNFDLPDIERNGYNFSDGIGIITRDLAIEVAEKLKLDIDAPSAYQIRYAGCKGVVCCWPSKGDGIRLSLRASMNKFNSSHTILEICSWTRFQPGFLNRQIITLLSTLKVPDEIFWKMQETMVSKLNQMLTDADVAFNVLTASCAEQGNVPAMMLSAGFKPDSEPHLRGMLTCVRAAQLWGLREKARIFVPSGRWLMGCLDELGVLKGGQCFIQVSTPSLEHCFSNHGSRFSKRRNNLEVIKGFVVIAKNPCLHPGDVRILEAVDAPGLHHLYDCLVFPQNGDRPHTNEASGSDLDGDLYFVTWDDNLVPPSKKSCTPMQYDPAQAKTLPRDVTQRDIIDFFSRNMVNENLGAICNAHVVHADKSEHGALDEKCIKLAELAATAVDFPKTGIIVAMPTHLKPREYPDFMGKEAYQSYPSPKILGRLYRVIRDAYDEDVSASSALNFAPKEIPYNADLEVSGADNFIDDAWDLKISYDGQLKGLMEQYKVRREEEIVTGQIWSMPKHNSRKQGDLKERLKHSYNSLRKEFRQMFEKMDPDFEKLTDDEKNILYEKKASAWYQVTYHPKWVKKTLDMLELDSAENTMLLSFPWIAVDYLTCIKIKKCGVENVDTTKPISSLAKYLADRI